MIDLRPMNEVRVDPATSHAWIQGGVLLGVLDQAAQPYGLATTAGNVSHTGVGGLTLGGGMGWLARQFGLSCDNLVSSEVVTADGRVVRASATQNPDLFWGLRGGGGNFGVVTEFEFELHPVSDQTLLVELSFPLEEAAAAVRGWRDLNVSAPRQATFTAWVGDVNGEPQVKVGFVWIGPPADGSSLLSAMRALGRPIGERVEELSYLALQQMDDTAEGPALRRYWKGHYFRSLSDDAIEAFIRRGTPDGVGEGLPAASLQAYGGAIADVRDADTAFSHRDTMFEFVTAARWSDPAEDADRTSAARRYAASLEPFASGVYVNSLTDEGNEGVRRAYPPAKLARLVEVKDAWDPENVFHLNHNIAPSRG
jgi:FAD/FMN-containing dehydrogenase